ncbi:MAG: MBL fold metallo-hydrolase, partial [Bacteroidota bacterium]
WDHIQGFPFFAPAYDSKRQFTISALGRGRDFRGLKTIFTTQMQEEYFPVAMESMGASFDFLESDIQSFVDEGVTFTAMRHNHPGGAYSYKIDDLGKTLVFSTDIEHGETLDENLIEFARGADMLVHDAQYTPEELPNHRGWGHSSWEQAIEVAERAGVKKLVLTHHDPEHDDGMLAGIERVCQQRFPNCVLAREKAELTV